MVKWLTYDEVLKFAMDWTSEQHWEEYPSIPANWLGERTSLDTTLRLAVELAKAQGVHPMPKEEEIQQLATVTIEEVYHDHYESRLEAYIEEAR